MSYQQIIQAGSGDTQAVIDQRKKAHEDELKRRKDIDSLLRGYVTDIELRTFLGTRTGSVTLATTIDAFKRERPLISLVSRGSIRLHEYGDNEYLADYYLLNITKMKVNGQQARDYADFIIDNFAFVKKGGSMALLYDGDLLAAEYGTAFRTLTAEAISATMVSNLERMAGSL